MDTISVARNIREESELRDSADHRETRSGCLKQPLAKAISGSTRIHSCEVHEPEIDSFVKRLETLYPNTEYVNQLMTHSWGQRVVRFYDPDGNLIEVGTPV